MRTKIICVILVFCAIFVSHAGDEISRYYNAYKKGSGLFFGLALVSGGMAYAAHSWLKKPDWLSEEGPGSPERASRWMQATIKSTRRVRLFSTVLCLASFLVWFKLESKLEAMQLNKKAE